MAPIRRHSKIGGKEGVRIAAVGGVPPNPEGEAHYTAQVFRALAEQVDGSITIFAHRQHNAQDVERLADNCLVLRVTYGYHPLRRHLAPLYLWRALREFRPDVVHFQAPQKKLYGGIGGEPLLWLFRYLRRRGLPALVTLHALWLPEDFAELAAERKWSPRVRATLEWLYRYYLREILALVPQVNALVAGDQNPLLEEVAKAWGLPDSKLVPEPHPCHLQPLTPSDVSSARAALGLPDARIVLAFGFVRPDKGFEYLIQAAAPLVRHDSRLYVIVAGKPSGALGQAYAEQLHTLRSSLGDPAQIVLEFGYVPDERLHTLLRACDVLVVPYTRVMGASGPMHHALGYGKPVIATAVGQNRGLGHVCRLVPPRDVDALREALRELLYDAEVQHTYHQQSLRYAAHHTWHDLARRYCADYERLTWGDGCQ
ncbi:MAG: glycosyltransferase [Armatimonadota bacterium]|nr:glycosyltransferase [Armatimonadota bacterium]